MYRILSLPRPVAIDRPPMNAFSASPDATATQPDLRCNAAAPPWIGPSVMVQTISWRNLRAEMCNANAQLEAQVNAQAWQLSLLRARFASYETALRGSLITVYTQDRDLRYTSITNPMLAARSTIFSAAPMRMFFPKTAARRSSTLKKRRWRAARRKSGEVSINDGPGLHWHELHVEPLRNEAGDIVGLTCASVDVTERKEGEAHLRHVAARAHASLEELAGGDPVDGAADRASCRLDRGIFLSQFGARLQALASSHDLLVRESWHGASLRELIHSQLVALISARRGAGGDRRRAGRAQTGGGAKSRSGAA